jgi:hypothetical protein
MDNSKLSKNDLDNLIDEMYKDSEFPSKVFLGIKAYEDEHTKLMIKKFDWYIQCFEHSFDLLINLVLKINYLDNKAWPPHRSIQLVLLKNSLYPLYSAFDRLLKGFYGDSTILLRTTYESLIRVLYVSYFPDIPYSSIISNPEKGQRIFILTNFLKDTLKVDWRSIYFLSSSFSHSYQYQTLSEVIEIHQHGQKELIRFKLQFNEKQASLPMNFTLFLLWCLIKFSTSLFVNPEVDKVFPNFYEKLIATERALGAINMKMPKTWSARYVDVVRIHEEIKEKEGITH